MVVQRRAFNMRRRSQNLDDIVINSGKENFQEIESCVNLALHQIFAATYHLPGATLIAYHNPLSVLMLVRCYVQRHCDEYGEKNRRGTCHW